MKDILNLFRRDAEHDYKYDEHGHDGMGKLKEGRLLKASGIGKGVEEVGMGEGHAKSNMRVTPPVMERGNVGRKDEGVYGRRW